MKLIDRALQYTVYDIGNGRVYKRRNTYREQSDVIRSWEINSLNYRIRKILHINLILKRALKKVKPLAEKYPKFNAMLGHPKFEGENYTQDKIVQMGQYLTNHSREENKLIIDRYIKLTQDLWTFGVHDPIFNFHLNNGVTMDGSVIQIDFGEFGFSKNSCLKKVSTKQWKNKWGYSFIKDLELQSYLSKRMDEEFTVEKVNQLWGTSL